MDMEHKQVYITRTASFLPNSAVLNEQMEDILGMIGGKPSKAKNIILRQNGIRKRYYSVNSKGEVTYTNAQLTAKAINRLFNRDISFRDIDLLACGTSIPDQLLPSHAVMVHGILGIKPVELISTSGVCCSGMQALSHAFLSVKSGHVSNAVASGSELVSPILLSRNFEKEYQTLAAVEKNPIIAFEKDFLRWMLSDGAGAFLLENGKRGELSLRIDWLETLSYAHELDVCMYLGAVMDSGGNLKSWKVVDALAWASESYFAIKQNTRLLGCQVVRKGVEFTLEKMRKHGVMFDNIDYVLPHISSMYFFDKLKREFSEAGCNIPDSKWFLNLSEVGNVGSASIFLMLDELFKSSRIKPGNRILLLVPESSRFTYSGALLTAV